MILYFRSWMATTALVPGGAAVGMVLTASFAIIQPSPALAQTCVGTPNANAPTPGTTVNCGSGTFNGTIGTWTGQHQGNINNVNVNVTPNSATNAVVNGGSDSAIIFANGGPSTINVGTPNMTTCSSGPLAIVTGNVNNLVSPG